MATTPFGGVHEQDPLSYCPTISPYRLVDTASDGHAAMQKMQASEYDLIITDFKMPQMSGRDLFNWIREHQPHLANRMIFVTGDTVSLETRSFFEDNQNRYLAKPFKIEEVKDVIQQTLESPD